MDRFVYNTMAKEENSPFNKCQSQKLFFCQNCGHQSAKWVGKCPSCNEWNTFVEEVVETQNKTNRNGARGQPGEKAPCPNP